MIAVSAFHSLQQVTVKQNQFSSSGSVSIRNIKCKIFSLRQNLLSRIILHTDTCFYKVGFPSSEKKKNPEMTTCWRAVKNQHHQI